MGLTRAILVLGSAALAASCGEAWRSADQQGRALYDAGEYASAAGVFRDPMWKGAALYAAKEFEAAETAFMQVGSADGLYSQGVCLALLGRYEEAEEAFGDALVLDPEHEDARFNRDLVRGILKAREDAGETPETDYTHYKPDEVKFDKKGERGIETEVDEQTSAAERTGELWLRQIRTTPAQFLERKFAIQAEGGR